MRGLWQDLKYGARVLLKRPLFTGIAVVTLALGIGANTAIFSVIYGVLLRPLPYQNGQDLVVLHQQSPLVNIDNLPFSVPEIEHYRQQNHTLCEVVEHHSMQFILYGGAEPENIETGVVSANFFDALGVKPLLGRTFVPNDDVRGAQAVMVLSYKYWQRSHGGDPSIIGRVFTMNDRPHTIVGVLPPIPEYPDEEDVYMPTSACPVRSSDKTIADRNWRRMTVFGRLKPGVQTEQARADVTTIATRLQQDYPDQYPANRGYSATLGLLQEELTHRGRTTFLVLLGTAGLVLFIACFNVANHILAHLMQRERELALRAALGASRARLIRQLLTENALLALAGGGLGILLAANGLDLLVRFAARFTTRAAEIKLDSKVLIFTLAVSLFSCLLFGLLPALLTRGG
ncbi:MAG TPA: ABC transporter permease, partial [Pyrinomonadaceae bacterium]|nr:ABC transporter permease [Pyrinomonadaceae bacterium]